MKKYLIFSIILICCLLLPKISLVTVIAETDFTDNKAIANVINKDVKSEVYLTYNEYDDSSSLKSNIKIIIKTNGEIKEILTNNLSGYNPKMFLGDFLGNGLNQVLLIVYNNLGEPFALLYDANIDAIKPIFNYDNFNDSVNIMLTKSNNLVNVNFNETTFIIDCDNNNELNYNVTKHKVLPYFNCEQNKYNLMVINKLNVNDNSYYIIAFIEITGEGSKIIKTGLIK